jgi:uncharacterized repeat protein (TIGR02543 family)
MKQTGTMCIKAAALLGLLALSACPTKVYTIINPPSGTCTVTFNANGGTFLSEGSKETVVVSGGKVTEPSGVTKAGCTLEGWYREAECATRWNFGADTVTSNITLYAKWTEAI